MLIYIDKTIEDYGKKNGLTEEERILFSELAVAHRYGHCLLCGDLKSVEWLIEILEGDQRAIYMQIRSRHSELRSIADAVETVLVLSYEDGTLIPSFLERKCRVMSVRKALGYNLNLRCSLIAENLDDCSFYELVAERYVYESGIRGVGVAVRHELGGGDTINTVFRKCVETDKVLALCLVDSDIRYCGTKQYPEFPAKGETAKKLEKTYNMLKDAVGDSTCELYCLPVHEVENLIPLSVLKSVAETSVPEMSCGVSYLEKLVSAHLEEAILCYDFKNGCAKVKNDPASIYWLEVAETVGDVSFPALCAKILEKAIEVLKGNTSDSKNLISNVHIDHYLLDLWKTIGLKVFSWGCANRPIRA